MHLIHQISMDQKPEGYSSSSSMANSTFSDQIPISFPSNNELGFMEMLGFQDHHDFTYPTSIWDFLINHPLPVPVPVPPPPLAVPSQSQPLPPPSLPSPAPSEVVNTPVTPNSSFSISSYSAEGTAATPNDDQQIRTESEKEQQQEDQQKSKKLLKPKKKNQKKREKEPRFAFKTKTEVEHLDDGFRWRKYGQKAVKNSPFPRSYYRCTTPACGVKKRVERSFEDSSIVVTTYEGTHTHPCPITGRASLTFMPVAEPATTFGGGVLELINTPGETSTIPTTFSGAGGGGSSPPFLIPEMLHSHHQHQVQPQTQQSQQQTFYNPTETLNINDGTNTNANVNPMSSFANLVQERRFCPQSTRDDGLLQDILPSKMLLIKDPIPKQG